MGDEKDVKDKVPMVPVKMHVPLSIDKIKKLTVTQRYYVDLAGMGSEFVFARFVKISNSSFGKCVFLTLANGPNNTPGMLVFRCTDLSPEARKIESNYTLFEYKLLEDVDYNRVESTPIADEDMYVLARQQAMTSSAYKVGCLNANSWKITFQLLCGILAAVCLITVVASVLFAFRSPAEVSVISTETLASERFFPAGSRMTLGQAVEKLNELQDKLEKAHEVTANYLTALCQALGIGSIVIVVCAFIVVRFVPKSIVLSVARFIYAMIQKISPAPPV